MEALHVLVEALDVPMEALDFPVEALDVPVEALDLGQKFNFPERGGAKPWSRDLPP